MDLVVAAALLRGPRVLLCHRSPTRRWFPDVWDFPGGHVEPGEPLSVALARELREELGVDVRSSALSVRPHHVVTGEGLEVSLWRIEEWDGEPVNAAPHEHDEIRWCDLSTAARLPLAHPSYAALFALWATQPRVLRP